MLVFTASDVQALNLFEVVWTWATNKISRLQFRSRAAISVSTSRHESPIDFARLRWSAESSIEILLRMSRARFSGGQRSLIGTLEPRKLRKHSEPKKYLNLLTICVF